jgi:c-di-GMP-binding flagellar brake protein YcgR
VNLFFKSSSPKELILPPDNSRKNSAHELVTTQQQITDLLREVIDDRHLVTVNIKGSEEPYNSALFELNPEGGYVLLDELIPREGNSRLSQEKSLSVKACVNGVILTFPAEIQEASDDNGVPFYKLAFPEAIDYKHRREYHRISPPLDKAVTVHLLTTQGRLVSGELRNLSLGGLCVRLSRQASVGIRVGDIISRCVIALPNQKKIITSLEIRNYSGWQTKTSRRVGGRFIELSKADQEELQQFVLSWDRQPTKG